MFTSSIKSLLTEGILCGFYAVMSKKCVFLFGPGVLSIKLMYFCFFDIFIAVAVVVATALYFDLKGHSVMIYGKTHVHKFV